MRRTILRTWIVLAVLGTLTIAACDSSESEEPVVGEVTATGTVTSDSGEPLEGASVEINRSDTGTTLASTSTDDTGTYEATFTVSEDNAPDQLQLRFSAAGFMSEEVAVDLSTEITVDVTLEELTPE